MSVTRKEFSAIATEGFEQPVKSVRLSVAGGSTKAELFIIGDAVNEDEYSITYNATDATGSKAFTIREYCPEEPKLRRTNDNCLVVSARQKAAIAAFAEECDRFTELYSMIKALAEKNQDNKKFAAFLPAFRLMTACDKNGKAATGSTVYIVTEVRDCMLYSDFIADLKADPARNPERRYLTHQSLLITLTECLKVFYESNLLKLDLSAAVFGIPKKQRDIPTETLYLLNIDAISKHSYEFVTKSSLEKAEAEKLAAAAAAQQAISAENEAPEEESIPEAPVPEADADDVPVTVIVDGNPADHVDDAHYEKAVVVDGKAAPSPEDEDRLVFVPAENHDDEEGPSEPVVMKEVIAAEELSAENTAAVKEEAKPAEAPAEVTEEAASAEETEKTAPAQEAPVSAEAPEEPAQEEASAPSEPASAEAEAPAVIEAAEETAENTEEAVPEETTEAAEDITEEVAVEETEAASPAEIVSEEETAPAAPETAAEENNEEAPAEETAPAVSEADATAPAEKAEEKEAVHAEAPAAPVSYETDVRAYGRIDIPAQPAKKTEEKAEPAPATKANEPAVTSFGRIEVPSAKPVEKPAGNNAEKAAEKPVAKAVEPSMSSFGKIVIPAAAPETKPEEKPQEKKENNSQQNKPAEKKENNSQQKKTAEKNNSQQNKSAGKKENNSQQDKPAEKKENNSQQNKSSAKKNNKPQPKQEKQVEKPADTSAVKQETKAATAPAEKAENKQQQNKAAEKGENKSQKNNRRGGQNRNKSAANNSEKAQPTAEKPAEKKAAPEKKQAENKPAPAEKPAENKAAPVQAEKAAEEKSEQKNAKSSNRSRSRRKPAEKNGGNQSPAVADLAFEPGGIFDDISFETEEELVSPEMEADIKSDIHFIAKMMLDGLTDPAIKGILKAIGTVSSSPLITAGIRTGLDWYGKELAVFLDSIINYKSKNAAPEGLDEFLEILFAMREQSVPAPVAAAFAEKEIVPVKKLEKLTSYLDRKRKLPVELSFRSMLYAQPVYAGLSAESESLSVMVLGADTVMFRFLGEIADNAVSSGKKVNIEVLAEYASGFGELIAHSNPSFRELFAEGSFCSFSFTDSETDAESIREAIKSNRPDCVFVCFPSDEETAEATKAVISADSSVKVYSVFDGAEEVKAVKKANVFTLADTSAWDKSASVADKYAFGLSKLEKCLEEKHTDLMATPDECNPGLRYIYDIADYAAFIGGECKTLTDAAGIIAAATEDTATAGRLIQLRQRKWAVRHALTGWARMTAQSAQSPWTDADSVSKKHIAVSDCTESAPKTEKEIIRLYAAGKLRDALEINYAEYLKKLSDRKPAEEEQKQFTAAVGKATWLLQDSKECSLGLVELRSIITEARQRRGASDAEFNKQYNALVKEAGYLGEEAYACLIEQLETLKKIFLNAVGVGTKLTYKQRHELAISSIPTVLTSRPDTALAVPFGVNPGADAFGSLSQFAAAGASKAIIIVYADSTDALDANVNALSSAFINSAGILSCPVRVLLVYKSVVPGEAVSAAAENLGSSAVCTAVKTVSVNRDSEVAAAVKKECTSQKITAVEKNGSELSMLLRGADFYEDMPFYSFNPAAESFTGTALCDSLKYARSSEAISVPAMFTYRETGPVESTSRQFFAENSALWNFYRRKPTSWKIFCELADQYNKMTSTVLTLRMTDIYRGRLFATKNYSYLLPGYAYETAKKVLDGFYRNGVITAPEYVVHWYTDDTIEVMFRSYEEFSSQLGEFFGNTGRFQSAERVEVYNSNRNVFVRYDSLSVKLIIPQENYNMYVERGTWRELNEILNTLAVNLRFIRELTIREGMISFRYASHDVKKILISAGSLLENYVCIKCRESGLFDDVRSNVLVNWTNDNPDLQNEFDVVLTRGYRSMFIECKAKKNLDQDFYYKLSCLADRFGINAKAVVVADTGETETNIIPDNEVKRMRGRVLGVETVFTETDIDNIAQVLSDLMDAE